tara:strand:+ start:1494 stop:1856 length:363 start_codon:yes stop_codon:yes gene_type:complete
MNKSLTLVFGASLNPHRHSNQVIIRLKQKNFDVIGFGNREGDVNGVKIKTDLPFQNIDTITMYMGARNQEPFIDDILNLNPRRIIFNPGAENNLLSKLARDIGIDVVEGCSMVMLALDEY